MDPLIYFLIIVVIVLGVLAYIIFGISKPTKIKELLKTYKRKEGAVKDLEEKYKKGELSSKEVMGEMKKRGIIVDAMSTTPMSMLINNLAFAGFILHVLPTIYIYSNGQAFSPIPSSIKEPFLSFLSQFQPIEIPLIVIFIAIAIAIAVSPLLILSSRLRIKKGGCSNEDTTVVLIKDGPYGVIRHPTHFTIVVWIVAGLIAASPWVYVTYLSMVGMLMIISTFYLMEINEEKFDQMKWGDEYRQYMKEVPRWNIIKGLLNSRKRKRVSQDSEV